MSKDKNNKAELLLSTDSISGYGLDLIFETAKNVSFDGIDLAIWKNFDSWNISYVKKLSEKYELPVKVIQLSENVNGKEMNQAIDMARQLGVNSITINAPKITNYKSYKFLVNNMGAYKRHNPNIKFSIINPPKSSLFILPIYSYRFTNIVEIFKKHKFYLGFDIVNIDDNTLETIFLRKIANFIPYISVVYLSDKTKTGTGHVPLGEGTLKLGAILRKFKQTEYYGYFSIKLDIAKNDLADIEKVEQILKKCRLFYKEHFQDLVIK